MPADSEIIQHVSIEERNRWEKTASDLSELTNRLNSVLEGLSNTPDNIELPNSLALLSSSLALLSSSLAELTASIHNGSAFPKASLDQAGIVQLSSGLSQDTNTAATPKLVDDLREQINTALTGLHDSLNAALTDLADTPDYEGLHNSLAAFTSDLASLTASIHNGSALPQASLDSPGIVQLSNDLSQDETLAITPKAVDDLRQSIEGNITELNERLASMSDQGAVELPEGIAVLGPDGKVPVDQLPQLPDASDTVKGIALLGAQGGAARYGQKEDIGLDNVTNDAQLPIAGGTMAGALVAGGEQAEAMAQVRNIIMSTTDLTAGASPLASGTVYLVYE